MPPNNASSTSVTRRGDVRAGSDLLRTVVWVGGEHDVATRVRLAGTIAHAAVLDDADIVVDLSGVTFMDASTIGALVEARSRLRAECRSLSVRAPSTRARRVLDLCGLTRLIDEPPQAARPRAATALGSWVDVPASHRVVDPVPPPPVADVASPPEPARAMVRRRVEPAESPLRPRAAS